MSIENKLTYLDGTKQALKTSINNLGGDITSETTFREYAQELQDIYNNIPKTTDTGTNLSLNTIKGKMKITPKGDTSQDTTTGKNLFSLGTDTYTKNGVTGNYDRAIFTLNGTTTASTNILNVINLQSIGTFSAGTYTFSTTILGGSLTLNGGACAIYIRNANSTSSESIVAQGGYNASLNLGFTLTASTQLYVQIYCNASNVVFNNYKMGIQIENGTKTNFEQYTGGIASPNPTYPQDIEVVTGTQEVK